MIHLILAAFLFQDAPVIDSVQSVTGGAARSGCWLPLIVTVRSGSAFEGRIRAAADMSFTVSRTVKITAGGTATFLLPVLPIGDGAKVSVALLRGDTEVATGSLEGALQFVGPRDILLLVEKDHPEAESLARQPIPIAGSRNVRSFISDPRWWKETAEAGFLEAVDRVLPVAADLNFPLWETMGGRIVRNVRADLEGFTAAGRYEAVDEQVGKIKMDSDRNGKSDSAVLFLAIYAFAIFVVAFAAWSRKLGAISLIIALLLTSLVFVGAYVVAFPKGDVVVRAWQVHIRSPRASVVLTLSKAAAGGDKLRTIEFGRFPKPVFASFAEARRAIFELRIEDGHRGTLVNWSPVDGARFLTIEPVATLPSPPPGEFPAGVGTYFSKPEGKRRGADAGSAFAPGVRSPDLVESAILGLICVEVP